MQDHGKCMLNLPGPGHWGVEADVAGFAARCIEEQDELLSMVACVIGGFGYEDRLLTHFDVCRAVYATMPPLFTEEAGASERLAFDIRRGWYSFGTFSFGVFALGVLAFATFERVV